MQNTTHFNNLRTMSSFAI